MIQDCPETPKSPNRRIITRILERYAGGDRFTVEDVQQDLGIGAAALWLLPFLVRTRYLECDRDCNGTLLGYRVP